VQGSNVRCSLYSIAFSRVKNPGNWDIFDLDYVLEQGDKIYKGLNKDNYLMFSELPREIHIFETTMNLEFLENKFGVLNYNSVCGTLFDRNLHSESDGVLILIKGICVSVTWNKRNFFLYDSQDKQGESSPNGAATLINSFPRHDPGKH